MKETKVHLSDTCELVLTQDELYVDDLCLEYVERSTYSYHSNSETSLDIEEGKAKEIIDLLHKAYPSLKEQS